MLAYFCIGVAMFRSRPVTRSLLPLARSIVLSSRGLPYNAVAIEVDKIPSPGTFKHDLGESLGAWKSQGKSCAWLTTTPAHAHLQSVAAEHGFVYHHAEGATAAMIKWLRDDPCAVPPFATHNIGVGGFVLNERGEVLVIKEQRSVMNEWKLPGGLANLGEEFGQAAIREVQEETGIKSSFVSIVSFRHQHRLAFGRSDIYVICRLRPESDKITIDEKEIAACKWMPLGDYIGQASNPMNGYVARLVEKHVAEQPHQRHPSEFTETQMESVVYAGRKFMLYHPPSDVPLPIGGRYGTAQK